MQTRPDSPDGATQRGRRVAVAHLFKVAHDDRFAISDRQRRHCVAQGLNALRSGQVAERVRLDGEYSVNAFVLITVLERLEPAVALGAPADVVPGNPAEPGGDRRRPARWTS